jgi:type III pantothenate kinase
MNLLVDIGNARIKWALQDGDSWTSGTPLLRQNKAFKDLARPAWKELETPQRVVVSSVAGSEYDKSVHTWVKRRWKLAPEFLQATDSQCGVTNAYKEPTRLGNDRWAYLLAAHAAARAPTIIVDCGTAITVDAITADGRHLGGLIAPGMELMASSLATKAPCIEILDRESHDIALLGSSTEVGVTGGVLYTAVSLVDRVFQDLRDELGRNARLLITGGDAERIAPLLTTKPVIEPELVLKGLAVFAESTRVEKEPVTTENQEHVEVVGCDS